MPSASTPDARTHLRVVRTIEEVRAWRILQPGSVGLVPTMGYLHEGHLSLVRRARADNDRLAITIFVNPTQFAPNEDFARYPRDEPRDLALLEAEGVDFVFAPAAEQIYPEGFATYVTVDQLSARLEGASRPTHFRGVTTVVAKLLNIVQPHRGYFGQKDAQQLILISRMVRDLNIPTEIVGMPIVRDPDGLALSSRNVYLTPEQREAALVLNRSLRLAESRFAAGERNATRIRNEVHAAISAEPLANIDYVSVADLSTLEELTTIDDSALVSVAVRFGATRLIDNTILSSVRT